MRLLYLIILFIIIVIIVWFFCGGKKYDFVGYRPLDPNSIIEDIDDIDDIDDIEEIEENIDKSEDDPIIECLQTGEGKINITPNVEDKFYVKKDLRCPNGKIREDTKSYTRGERICKDTLEKLYGLPFKKERLKCLENPLTGRRLELDCYNEQLQIAVEYNGIQHYVWPNYTGQSYEDFIYQIQRDQLKVELCDKNGIYLITVPYNIPMKKIPDYIQYYLPENVQRRSHNNTVITEELAI